MGYEQLQRALLFLRIRLQNLLCIERYKFLEAQYEKIRAAVLEVRIRASKIDERTLENLKGAFE